jgi:ferredoxin
MSSARYPAAVSEGCIECRYTDCVDVRPVDCFPEGPNFLAIDPDECIHCAVCVAGCPVNATIYAADDVPAGQQYCTRLNADLAPAGRASQRRRRRSRKRISSRT